MVCRGSSQPWRVESRCGAVARGPGSTSRSSNRAGRFAALGSRTRNSCLRPRQAFGKLRTAHQPETLVQVMVGVACVTPIALPVFLTQPPAQPRSGVGIDRLVCLRDGTQIEVIGPA